MIHDGYQDVGAWLGAARELVLVSHCCYGSLSPAVKRVLDRAISYIHPYFVTREGQMHHRRRYPNQLHLRAYLYGAASDAEKETARRILAGNAVNYDGVLETVQFYDSAAALLREVRL